MLTVRNVSLAALALALAISFTASRATAQDAKKGSISGKVTKADGTAAANAKVMLMKPADRTAPKPAAEEGQKPKGEKQAPVAETTADADGKYTLADVEPGKYVLGANLKGEGRVRQPIEVKAGEALTVDLKIEAPKPK
jgi:hypothetical protein